ncbi:MAG: type II toxin-antitoxin system VapC family toxin [Acidobacteriota bacterium]
MILVDANLLLYAYLSMSEHHAAARAWVEKTFSGPRPVRLAWITILAFLRISTNPSLRGRPLRMEEAAEAVREWLSQPAVEILSPGDRHWEILRDLLNTAQVRGPLTSDAHLAALAIEHGATLCTCDRDFTRFAGLRAVNPLEQ